MGGDPPAPTAQETTSEMLQAVIQHLPALVQVTGEVAPQSEADRLAVAQQYAPQWGALQQQMFDLYGPQLGQTAANIEAQARRATAAADADIMSGPGRDLVEQTLELQRLADPEYFALREQMGGQLGNLLGSIDVNGLSPSERREMEAALYRQNMARGNATNPSAITTLESANQFGSALQAKRNALGQALGVAAGAAPTLRTGIDTLQASLNRPSQAPGLATSQFAGVQQPDFGDRAFSLSGQLLDQAGQNARQANDINANRRDSLDRFNQTFSTVGQTLGSFT